MAAVNTQESHINSMCGSYDIGGTRRARETLPRTDITPCMNTLAASQASPGAGIVHSFYCTQIDEEITTSSEPEDVHSALLVGRQAA